MRTFSIFLLVMFAPLIVSAETSQHKSQYEGEQRREITSLSADDISEIQRGGGWGLAKPAELNGVPGPAHLLEMKDEISLTKPQISKIENLYERMLSDAIPLGYKFIEAERQLDLLFKSSNANSKALRQHLKVAETTKAELRYVHLSKHLEASKVLTEQQISLYNTLRGYTDDDICSTVPKGHNAEMFRKHNSCE